jgi:hypothetical protein
VRDVEARLDVLYLCRGIQLAEAVVLMLEARTPRYDEYSRNSLFVSASRIASRSVGRPPKNDKQTDEAHPAPAMAIGGTVASVDKQ